MEKLICFKCDATYLKDIDEIDKLIKETASNTDEDLCESCAKDNDWLAENIELEEIKDFERHSFIENELEEIEENN